MKTIIESPSAPKPIGAYSQACKVGNQLFLSGQIGLDPKTGKLVSDDVKTQFDQCIKNFDAVCVAANTNLQNVVKLNIYLMDMTDFPIINDLVEQHFQPLFPARAVIQVAGLPKNAKVEMDGIAFVSE